MEERRECCESGVGLALINKCSGECLGNNGTRLKVQFSSSFLDCRHYVQHIQWGKMREITETRKTWHYAVFAESLHVPYIVTTS